MKSPQNLSEQNGPTIVDVHHGFTILKQGSCIWVQGFSGSYRTIDAARQAIDEHIAGKMMKREEVAAEAKEAYVPMPLPEHKPEPVPVRRAGLRRR